MDGRLGGWKVGRFVRLEGWKIGRLDGWKVGKFKGFCNFSCLQTLLEKVGRLEHWPAWAL